MAGEIQVPYGITALTLYARVRNTIGQPWRTDTLAFGAYSTAQLANYTVALTEQGTASGVYVGNFPSDIPVGTYNVTAYVRAGGSPAESDTVAGVEGSFDWSGTAVVGSAAINGKTTNLPVAPAAVGSLMGLADGAITDAKVTVPAEAAGRPSTMLGMLRRLFEWTANKRTRSRTTGDVIVFGGDNSTTLETQTQSTAGSTDTQTKGA